MDLWAQEGEVEVVCGLLEGLKLLEVDTGGCDGGEEEVEVGLKLFGKGGDAEGGLAFVEGDGIKAGICEVVLDEEFGGVLEAVLELLDGGGGPLSDELGVLGVLLGKLFGEGVGCETGFEEAVVEDGGGVGECAMSPEAGAEVGDVASQEFVLGEEGLRDACEVGCPGAADGLEHELGFATLHVFVDAGEVGGVFGGEPEGGGGLHGLFVNADSGLVD